MLKADYNKFQNIIKNFILFIFGMIVLYLLVNSVVITTDIDFITPYYETNFYKQDSPFIHLIFFILFSGLLIILKKVNINEKIINIKRVYIAVFFLFLAFALTTRFPPKSDQSIILSVAEEMYNHNFSDFLPGGYVEKYPHQVGMVILLYFMRYIFGEGNYLAFYIINVFAFLLYFYSIINITKIIFKGRFLKFTVLFLVLFFPIGFYVTFLYGNMIGFAFSLLSIIYMLKFFEDDKAPRKNRYAVLSAVFISMAVILKQNYLIFFLGNIVYILLNAVKRKRLKPLLMAVVMTAFLLSGNFICHKITESVTGAELKGGIPSTAYIAMGLQDDSVAPGWFDGYNLRVYSENENDTEKANEAAIEKIEESLDIFADDPEYAAEFFSKKTISQWLNPSFQCFWLGQTSAIMCNLTNLSPFMNDLFFGRTNDFLTGFLNILQTIILAGAFLYICYEDKENIEFEKFIFAVIFIGGFIFHMFWEGKCQYTITYFAILIPYTAKGYDYFTDKLLKALAILKSGRKIWPAGEKDKNKNKNKNEKRKIGVNSKNVLCAAGMVIFIFLICVSYNYSRSEIFDNKENTDVMEKYYKKKLSASALSTGVYTITPKIVNDGYVIAPDNEETESPSLKLKGKGVSDLQNFFVSKTRNFYTLRNVKLQKNIDVFNETAQSGVLSLYNPNISGAQQFEIRKSGEEGLFYIMWKDEYAITFNEDTGKAEIAPFDEGDSQKWRFFDEVS